MHGATSLRYNYKANSSNKELVYKVCLINNSEALCAKVDFICDEFKKLHTL